MIESNYLMTRISKAQRERQASFGFLLQLLARRMDSVMKEKLAEIDVDKKIFANLRLLAERDGVSQRELGRLLEFPEYYTSRNVDALIDAGYAIRKPDPKSRRSVLIFLTEAGREKAMELPKIIDAANKHFLDSLGASEKSALMKLLHKVAEIPEGGDPNL